MCVAKLDARHLGGGVGGRGPGSSGGSISVGSDKAPGAGETCIAPRIQDAHACTRLSNEVVKTMSPLGPEGRVHGFFQSTYFFIALIFSCV